MLGFHFSPFRHHSTSLDPLHQLVFTSSSRPHLISFHNSHQLSKIRKISCPFFNSQDIRMMLTEEITEPTQWDLKLSSPSKVNIFLRIIRKREDGYHDLASLFQAISLHDDLYFKRRDPTETKDILYCDTPGVPTDGSNLILKALAKHREKTGSKQYYYVKLIKKVPFEAGLGGGSANASTALYAANYLSGSSLSMNTLAEYGAEFGSDISFFFSSGTAYCTGRGEIMSDQEALQKQSLYIIKPKIGLSTGLVFKNLDFSKVKNRDPQALLKGVYQGDFENCCINDLEGPSFELVPELAELKKTLKSFGFKVVLMSGSGTSFFALGKPTNCEPTAFMDQMVKDHDARVYRASFINRAGDSWFSI